MTLDPGSWISWIIVGLIAGAIAARVVAGRGFGCIADIVVGVAGALIGGFLASLLGINIAVVGHPIISAMIIAFVGAALLLLIVRMFSGSRSRRRAF